MRPSALFAFALLAACEGTTEKEPQDSELTPIVDLDGDGFDAEQDCDDEDAAVHPQATETCDGVDNDCDGTTDQNASDALTWYTDADGDGYGDSTQTQQACTQPEGSVAAGEDCDDGDPSFHPGAEELDCTDPNDYNCDGSAAYADADGDGFAACEDCDDTQSAVNSAATELCNGQDDNCDGATDEDSATDATTWYQDIDGDGFGDTDYPSAACSQPEGYSPDSSDCDDGDADVYPLAQEVCNGTDDDCDTQVDDADASLDLGTRSTWYADSDGDGYGDPDNTQLACTAPTGSTADDRDCDDGDKDISPAGSEVCDGADNDCDSLIDDADSSVDLSGASTWYADSDGDGYGDADVATLSCDAPSGYVADDSDCVDSDASLYPDSSGLCPVGGTCLDILNAGLSTGSGAYLIDPDGSGSGEDPITVSCDMSTDGGGWTLALHFFDMGSLSENSYIKLFGHNLWTDERWSYDGGSNTMSAGLNGDTLVSLSTQGSLGADSLDGLWDDLRMTCSQSDSSASESHYAQVDSYASTNGNYKLLGAASNGSSYTVTASKVSTGQTKIWHDNETSTSNSGHYLCDYTNSATYGAAPQFGFCYTDHLNNPNTSDYGDSIVSLSFGYAYGDDSWSTGFTLECGNMSTTALQNTGTVSIWVR